MKQLRKKRTEYHQGNKYVRETKKINFQEKING